MQTILTLLTLLPTAEPPPLPMPALAAEDVVVRYGSAERPSSGLGLLIPGTIVSALGVGVAILTGLVAADGDSDEVGLVYALAGLSAAAFGVGVPMMVVGSVRYSRYKVWLQANGLAGVSGPTLGLRVAMSF